MNFLLGASLIILLLFPGLVFRLLYLNTPYNRGFSFTLAEELLFSLVPTLIIHMVCMPFTQSHHLDFSKLYRIVVSDATVAPAVTVSAVRGFLLYCLVTYILAGVLGFAVQRMAMRLNWDINVPMFRIHNEWYYLLRGIFIVSPKSQWRRFARIDHIQVDAVVDIAGTGYVYTGSLTDFVLSKNEGIDRLYLGDTVRRQLVHDAGRQKPAPEIQKKEGADELVLALDDPEAVKDLSEQWEAVLDADDAYYVPGTRFCLSFKEIKNLNITYIIEVE